jgi:hypothetical protein
VRICITGAGRIKRRLLPTGLLAYRMTKQLVRIAPNRVPVEYLPIEAEEHWYVRAPDRRVNGERRKKP